MRGRKLLVVGVVVLLVAVLGTVLFSLLIPSTTKKTSDAFVASVLAGDATTTYSQLALSTQATESNASWTATVNRLSKFFEGKTPTFESEQTDKATDTTAASRLATYTIKGSDGTYRLSVLWSEEESGWFVQVFNSELIGTP